MTVKNIKHLQKFMVLSHYFTCPQLLVTSHLVVYVIHPATQVTDAVGSL